MCDNLGWREVGVEWGGGGGGQAMTEIGLES